MALSLLSLLAWNSNSRAEDENSNVVHSETYPVIPAVEGEAELTLDNENSFPAKAAAPKQVAAPKANAATAVKPKMTTAVKSKEATAAKQSIAAPLATAPNSLSAEECKGDIQPAECRAPKKPINQKVVPGSMKSKASHSIVRKSSVRTNNKKMQSANAKVEKAE